MKLSREDRPYLLALLVLGVTIFLSKLWQGDMRGDSLFYAQIAKEILRTGDWLTMHFAGNPYFNKPPLLFWLTAITYKVFGVTSFSARLWSPLLALFCGLALYFLGRQLFDRRTAFLAALVLFMTRDFIKDNMGLRMDSAICLSVALTILFLQRGGAKATVLGGLALAMGLLAKGIVALYSVGVLFLLMVLDRDPPLRRLLSCLVIGGGVFGLWFGAVYLQHGEAFINTFLLKQTLGRVTGAFQYSKGKTYYLKVLLTTYWPWLALLPLALYWVAKKAPRRAKIVIFGWIGAVAFSLLFPKPEYGRYMMPLYPAFAIALGFFLSGLLNEGTLLRLARAFAIGGIVAFFVLNIFPFRLHRITYDKLREVKPSVEYWRKRGKELWLLAPRMRTYHASVFYLDLKPRVASTPKAIPPGTLVLTEGRNRRALGDTCQELLYNGRYGLFLCPE